MPTSAWNVLVKRWALLCAFTRPTLSIFCPLSSLRPLVAVLPSFKDYFFFGFINCLSCTITHETHSDITLPPFVTSWEVVLYSGAPRSALAVAHVFLSLHYSLTCARVSEVGRGPSPGRLSFYGQRALSHSYLTHACYTLQPEGLRPGGTHWTLLICRG